MPGSFRDKVALLGGAALLAASTGCTRADRADAPQAEAKPAATAAKPPVRKPGEVILPSPWQPPAVIDPVPPPGESEKPGPG